MIMRRLTLLMAGALLLSACAAGPIVSDDFEEKLPAAQELAAAVEDEAPPASEVPVEEPGEHSLTASEEPIELEPDEGENVEEVPVVADDKPEPSPVVPIPTPPPPPAIEPIMTGQVPAELMDAILADASSRSATKSALTVIRAEAVTWSDGSLGCPEKGMSYTQALVDGYWVVLDSGGLQMDYRAGTGGGFKYCAIGGLPPVGPGNT